MIQWYEILRYLYCSPRKHNLWKTYNNGRISIIKQMQPCLQSKLEQKHYKHTWNTSWHSLSISLSFYIHKNTESYYSYAGTQCKYFIKMALRIFPEGCSVFNMWLNKMKCHFSLCNIFSKSSLPRAYIPYNAHGIRKMQKLKEIRKLNYITCTKFVGCVISWKTACFTMYYTCNLKKLVCLIYRVRIPCQGLDCRQMMKGLVDAILNINIELRNRFDNLF